MMLARLAAVAAVAALAVAALPAGSIAANECSGIPRCISVQGPWVAVPPTGEAEYLLECPGGKGVVAGTDALASSQDVHATFDGYLSSPIAFGRTTATDAFFRAVSGHHRAGMFEPFAGCIPAPQSLRNTLGGQPSPIGAPLDLRMILVKLRPGAAGTVSVSCPVGEVLVDSWNAKAFATTAPPPPQLAQGIQLKTTLQGRKAMLEIATSEALPLASNAEVQLGVRCAPA